MSDASVNAGTIFAAACRFTDAIVCMSIGQGIRRHPVTHDIDAGLQLLLEHAPQCLHLIRAHNACHTKREIFTRNGPWPKANSAATKW
jgi:hypothetical protein